MTKLKKLRLALAVLAGLFLAQMYLQMGLAKLDPDGFWTAPFERWGYPVWLRVTVGVLEVGAGVAMVVPWIASWGAAVLTVVMIGAIATRAGDGAWVDVAWNALFVATILWIGAEWWKWRRPRLPL